MRAFIYCGGELHAELVTELPQQGDLVIAADGGYRHALACGAAVQVLLGDFDSLGEASLPEGLEVHRLPPEKDLTDTQLAVDLALQRGATELVLVGGLGGRLDHTLSNLAILERLEAQHLHGLITNGKNRVRFLRNNSTLIPRSSYRYLSLIAADEVVRGVTVEGCKYPLKRARLTRTLQYAVSNELTGNCALIDVRRGGVWIVESRD